MAHHERKPLASSLLRNPAALTRRAYFEILAGPGIVGVLPPVVARAAVRARQTPARHADRAALEHETRLDPLGPEIAELKAELAGQGAIAATGAGG